MAGTIKEQWMQGPFRDGTGATSLEFLCGGFSNPSSWAGGMFRLD